MMMLSLGQPTKVRILWASKETRSTQVGPTDLVLGLHNLATFPKCFPRRASEPAWIQVLFESSMRKVLTCCEGRQQIATATQMC